MRSHLTRSFGNLAILKQAAVHLLPERPPWHMAAFGSLHAPLAAVGRLMNRGMFLRWTDRLLDIMQKGTTERCDSIQYL